MNVTNISNNKGITLIAMMLTITVLIILLGVSTTLTIINIEKSKAQMHIANLEEKYTTISKYISTNDVNELIERDVEIMHPIDQEKVNVKKLDNNKLKDILNLGEFKELYLSQDNLEFFGKIDREDLTYKGVPLYVKASTNIVHNFKYDKQESLNLSGQSSRVRGVSAAPNVSDIPENLKIGDTIIYDPTKGVTDNSKLTYTSQKGTARTGGNGYGTQTVTAKAEHKEWIVISTANNKVKVISKEPILGVTGGKGSKFTLKGGIGWLYAEEELHKACSIYGHGKGAVQTTTTYKIGNYNVPGEAQTKTLLNSAARSMTMEDIVKIMKGEDYLDFTEEEKKFFEPSYMDSGRKSKEIFYPTITSTKENGNSTTKERYENEGYFIKKENNKYDKELVTDPKVKENKEKLKNHIYKNNKYWLASRLVVSYPILAEFRIRDVSSTYVAGYPLYIYVSNLTINVIEEFIRPVVYLQGGMLEEQAQGVWKIKE